MEELNKIVNWIKNTKEYEKCIELKDKMDKNDELVKMISDVKKKQKEYVKSNFDEDKKKELDLLNEKLNEIPIYNSYNRNLEIVNGYISYVRDELNDYFCKVFNDN